MLNATTIAVLRASKNIGSDKHITTWVDLVNVLGPLYSYDIKLNDVMHILLRAYASIGDEPRFETRVRFEELVMAPTKCEYIEPQMKLDTTFTLEEFYNKQIRFIMNQFRFCRSDWCIGMLTAEQE